MRLSLPKRLRWIRLPRFSFRTLLVIVAGICVALSFYFPRTYGTARFRISVPNVAFHESLIRSPLVIVAALRDAEVHQLPILVDRSDPVAWLQKELTTTLDGDVLVLRLGGRPWESRQLQLIVNAVVDAYARELEFQRLPRTPPKSPPVTSPSYADIIMRILMRRPIDIDGEQPESH